MSRLNSVVLPELGGPISATALGGVSEGGNSSSGVVVHARQSLHWLIGYLAAVFAWRGP